jgi:nicotinamidase-related amidase
LLGDAAYEVGTAQLTFQGQSGTSQISVKYIGDDENFKTAVDATGRHQLIMGAITTDICLVFPAISAVEDGYEVQAVLDACGSPFEIGEEVARRRMERAGVWLTSTNTMIAELVRDWSTPAVRN